MKKRTAEEKKIIKKIIKLAQKGLNEEEIIEKIKEDIPEAQQLGLIADKVHIRQTIANWPEPPR